MSRRAKGWLLGGWLVLVAASWAYTESINDGIEPTSGPRPKPSTSISAPPCPMPAVETDRTLTAYAGTEPDFVATAIACSTAD
ncbi:hypothetical protein [Streptomyces sp. NPDC059805]|uniref:hypothetical protein n=1 Tax=Streptomyces sp. NPDC059805 TaxID=3346954 RepID=UPI00364C5717